MVDKVQILNKLLKEGLIHRETYDEQINILSALLSKEDLKNLLDELVA